MRERLRGHSLYSPSNGRRFEHWVWTPPHGHGALPLVVLLHGVNDAGGFVWWQNAAVDLVAEALVERGELPPFRLLLPGDTGIGLGSGWCDWADGSCAAETYVVRELLPWAAETFGVGDVHIGGLSMGGYGALLLALRNPGVFRSASATSAFFDPRRLLIHAPAAAERIWDGASGEAMHDVRRLVLDPSRRGELRIALDCGDADHLVDDNRAFHALLDGHGIAHTYVERPGAHTWDYWSARVEHHLRFHLECGGDLMPAGDAREPATAR